MAQLVKCGDPSPTPPLKSAGLQPLHWGAEPGRCSPPGRPVCPKEQALPLVNVSQSGVSGGRPRAPFSQE